MSLHKRIVVLMAVIVASLALVSVAVAITAGPWTLTTSNGVYSGSCNFDATTGWQNCHGTLVSGSPEDTSAVVIKSGTCTLVLTPSGVANMNCRK